ncbi:MAG: hypothetical protein HY752_03340 [Nitrospirae bacterium]|nr:hypothetical protein [Nitrospirota bacterium]
MEELKLIAIDYSVLSEDVIEIILLDSSVEPLLFEEIAKKNIHRPEVLHHVLNNPRTPETTRQFVAQVLKLPIHVAKIEPEEVVTDGAGPQRLLQKIQTMKIGDKIQLAIKGGRDIRSILIRDPNKEIMIAVLGNPKITESEIEIMAKQKTSSEDILRIISKRREWMKNYSILHALVINPKTPPGIALSHIHTLRTKDLVRIGENKFVPEAVRAAAKKLVAAKKPS